MGDYFYQKSKMYYEKYKAGKLTKKVGSIVKFKLEYGDRLSFTGETEEQYEYFNDYLIRVEYFINLMKDIVDTNYFEYYYYNVEEEVNENE